MRLVTLLSFMTAAAPALAEDERIPETAVEVEVHDNFIMKFNQIDIMTSGDPVEQIAGVSDQFLGGEMILGEVFLKQPLYREQIKAIAKANGTAGMSFRCDRAGLYRVEDTHLVGGEGCEIVSKE